MFSFGAIFAAKCSLIITLEKRTLGDDTKFLLAVTSAFQILYDVGADVCISVSINLICVVLYRCAQEVKMMYICFEIKGI